MSEKVSRQFGKAYKNYCTTGVLSKFGMEPRESSLPEMKRRYAKLPHRTKGKFRRQIGHALSKLL